MANDVYQINPSLPIKNHGAYIMDGTPDGAALTYPVNTEGFDTVENPDLYSQRVLAGRFHYNDSHVILTPNDCGITTSGDLTITYAAQQGLTHELHGVEWSYTSIAAQMGIEIQDNGVVVRHLHGRQNGSLKFEPPVRNQYPNSSLTVTLHGPYPTLGVTGYMMVEHGIA